MKNSIFRFICLIISVSVAFCCFAGCNDQKEAKTSVSSEPASFDASDNAVSNPEDPGDTVSKGEDLSDDTVGDGTWQDTDDTENTNKITHNVNGEELILDEVNIQNSKPLTNTFMGNGAGVYCAYNFLDYSEVDLPIQDKFVAKEFERFQNMGVYQLRSKLDYRWLFDENKQGWDFESEDAKAVYKWLDLAKEYDMEVMFNPWYFAWIEALDYPDSEMGNPDTPYLRTDSFEENSKRWCNVTTEFYKNLYARGYHNVKYLFVFTEPLNLHTNDNSAQHYVDNLKRLHETLEGYKLRNKIQIVGPNRIGGDFDKFDIHRMIYEQCDYAIDIYSQHNYLQADNIVNDTYSTFALLYWDEAIKYFRECGITKPVWIDEWNVRDMSLNTDGVGDNNAWTGVQQGVGVTYAMNSGYSNAVIWMLADQQWPLDFTDPSKGFNKGLMFHGFFQDIRITTVPKMQYYSYSLFSKYCGRGNGKTYFCDNHYEEAGVYVSCVETSEGEWTVIAVNTNYDDVKLDFNFENSLGGVKLYRHQYLATEAETYPNAGAFILPANKTIHDVTTSFSDILPGYGSVQVYTTIKG